MPANSAAIDTQSLSVGLLNETLLSFGQAARKLPAHRGPGRCSPATIWRWIRDGVKLPDGRRLRLEAIRIGGAWRTSEEALGRFVAAQTAAYLPSDAPATIPIRSPNKRQRDSERAARELEAEGA